MRESILVIAKDTAVRAQLARRLGSAGYRVELAQTLQDARRHDAGRACSLVILADGPLGPESTQLAEELSAITRRPPLVIPSVHGGSASPGFSSQLADKDLLRRVAEVLDDRTEAPPPRAPVLLGRYVLDLDGHTLTDTTGAEVALTRAEFSILCEFVRHPGRVLPRDYLARVLSGRGSEPYERGVDMLIVRLRRKIELDPKRPSLILTVPGFGYKFSGKAGPAAALPTASVSGIETPLIAVLPFADLSGEPSSDHLADQIGKEVATILATFPSIRVIVEESRTEPASPDSRRLGQTRGARYVLSGSVMRQDRRLHVMAQLLDPASAEQVWARRYDADSGDSVTGQSYVAENIGYSLAGSEGIVMKREGRCAWRKSSSELTEYDYYTRGQTLRYLRNREDYAPVRQVWNEGLTRFPDSALLRIMLAITHVGDVEMLSNNDPAGAVERAWELAIEAETAAGISPLTAMLHSWVMAALYQWHEGDFDRSVASARLTIRMAPYQVRARSNLAVYLANAGRIDEAIEWSQWAMRHNPRPGYGCNLAYAYYLAGRHEEALAVLDQAGTEYIPQLAAVYVRLGRIAEARAVITSWLKTFPNVTIARMALEPIREPWKQRWLDDLRTAGLPEGSVS